VDAVRISFPGARVLPEDFVTKYMCRSRLYKFKISFLLLLLILGVFLIFNFDFFNPLGIRV
jgi:hypothetical protein